MSKIALIIASLLLFTPSTSIAASMADYPELIAPATSNDFLFSWDDSSETGSAKIMFPGLDTQFLNGQGEFVILDLTESDPIFVAWGYDFGDMLNVPSYLTVESDPIFIAWDKDYNDLINQPAIPTNTDEQTALQVPTDTTNFNNNLSAADTDIQKALETLDGVSLLVGDMLAANNLSEVDPATARTNLDVYSKAEADAADGTGTDDQTALEVTSTATGDIAATNVDAAIAELEAEKQDDLGITSIATVSTDVDAFMRAANGELLSTLGAEPADATIVKEADAGTTFLAPTGDGSGLTGISAGTDAVLTGFTSGAGTVAATDTILESIEKLDGNIAGVSVGSPLVTAPTYSDDTCTAGTYAYATSPSSIIHCRSTNVWDYQEVSGANLVWASWSNPTPTAGTLAFSPTSWDPADAAEGTTADTQEVTVTATGGGVTFTSYALGGSNFFTDAGTGTCSGTEVLAEDGSCTVDLIFSYTTEGGPYSDTLTVNSDATDDPNTMALGPVTVSAATVSYMAYSDAQSYVLGTFDAVDGSTIVQGGTTITAEGFLVESTDIPISITATDGSNIDWDEGSIGFGYIATDTTPAAWDVLFTGHASASSRFVLYASSSTSIQFSANGVSVVWSTVPNIYSDQLEHDVILSYDHPNNTCYLWIDGTRYAPDAQQTISAYVGMANLYFGAFAAPSANIDGTFTYFWTKDTVTE